MPIHDPIPTPHAPQGPLPAFVPMSAAKLRDWVRDAQRGARIVYSRGAHVDSHCAPDVVTLARQLYEGGFIRLHLKRSQPGGPMEYLAVRTARPVLLGTVL